MLIVRSSSDFDKVVPDETCRVIGSVGGAELCSPISGIPCIAWRVRGRVFDGHQLDRVGFSQQLYLMVDQFRVSVSCQAAQLIFCDDRKFNRSALVGPYAERGRSLLGSEWAEQEFSRNVDIRESFIECGDLVAVEGLLRLHENVRRWEGYRQSVPTAEIVPPPKGRIRIIDDPEYISG